MADPKSTVRTPLRKQLILLAILPVILTAVILTIAAASVTLRNTQDMLENQLKTVAYVLSFNEDIVEGLTGFLEYLRKNGLRKED